MRLPDKSHAPLDADIRSIRFRSLLLPGFKSAYSIAVTDQKPPTIYGCATIVAENFVFGNHFYGSAAIFYAISTKTMGYPTMASSSRPRVSCTIFTTNRIDPKAQAVYRP